MSEYMVNQLEGVECALPPSQSALLEQMSTSVAPSGGLGVSVMQTIADLLTAIMEHKDNHKASVSQQNAPDVLVSLPTIWVLCHKDE